MDNDLKAPIRVGILLFEQVDLLDVGGPYEVFLTAARLAQRRSQPVPFEVITLGLSAEPVTAHGGLQLTPDTVAAASGPLDLLVVPGAVAINEVASDPALVAAIRDLSPGIITSVCTGAFLLAEAGLLEGRPWTTHWEDVEALELRTGSRLGQSGVQWVDDGDVVTAGGLSSGIAMALHLVHRLCGIELATATAAQIAYSWDPSGRN